jgi:hypothetical protein
MNYEVILAQVFINCITFLTVAIVVWVTDVVPPGVADNLDVLHAKQEQENAS